MVARGFRAYKIHPGMLSTPDVIRMVTMVRETVGPAVRLMLDPNCGYGYRKALDIGRALDQNGFHWFEDPVPHYDLDAIKSLSERLDVPLCMSDQNPNQFFNAANLHVIFSVANRDYFEY